jgi:hypothetical protein
MVGRQVVGERADARWNADPSDTAAKSCFLENFLGRFKHFNAGDPVFLDDKSPQLWFCSVAPQVGGDGV